MRTASVALAALLLAACDKDPPPLMAACHPSLERGRSMLAVPDVAAARDWLEQARKQCGTPPPAEVAQLEEAIAGVERHLAEVAEKKRLEAEPKPASESLVPKLVAAVAKYRDTKGREKCKDTDDGRCSATAPLAGSIVAQLWTVQGKPDALLAFTTLPKEKVTCDQLGPNQVKKTWRNKAKVYCALTDGALKGLFAILSPSEARFETDVNIFSAKGAELDEALKGEIATGSADPTPQ